MWRSRTRGRLICIAPLLCALAAPGCADLGVPRIDPSGQRVFATPPCPSPAPCPAATAPVASPSLVRPNTPAYRSEPGQPLREDDVAVVLNPHRTVAPVGSEVVLLAGVRGGDGYLSTNRRLEWSISQGSVGHFVSVGEKSFSDYLVGDFTQPRKLSNTFAIGNTSRHYTRLDRGTPTPADDVCVQRGQGWITITSPVEGTSNVMVYSPDVVPWDGRVRTASIHWIDAQFGFPPPAINPAGSRHVFTTTVLRQSNHCPHAGWIVRYEILGGPPAGFAPDGAQAVEVPTDPAGQASAEIFQKQPTHGTNQIRIQVIRPAEAVGGPGGERLVVSTGGTLKTWTAAALAVRKAGPPTAAIGATVTYSIDVSNPGDLPAREVVATDDVPEGLTFVNATPAPEVSGKRLQWKLPDLAPGQRQSLQASFRVGQQGSVTNCAEVTAAGGLKASDCATTTVMAAAIDVSTRGPEQVAVGARFTFEVVVTNRGQVPATGLTIKDRFGDGLEAEVTRPGAGGQPERIVATSPIDRVLGDLGPGQSKRLGVTFRATRSGRLCHTVEILGPEGFRVSAEGCVTAVEAGAGPPTGTTVTPAPGTVPAERSPLTVTKTGPQAATVGQSIDFVLRVTNVSSQPLSNVRIVDHSDANLRPDRADGGFQTEGNDLIWTLPTLTAGTTVTYRVQSTCLSPAARACNHVTVTVQGGSRAETDAYVEIRAAGSGAGAAPGGLSLTVSDLQNPVVAGNNVTYLARVTNNGTAPESQVVVTATIPSNVAYDPLGTRGPESTTFQFSTETRTLTFTAAPDLPPGESLTYRIRVKTKQAGQVRMQVGVTSRSQPQPVIGERMTDVNPPQG
jgi:uncharacterized repeat protein (TIGR01451 family)